MCTGAIHRDDSAEADAEEALPAGKAKSPDCEILLVGEDFDEDGKFQFDVVAGLQGFGCILQQLDDRVAVDLGFVFGHSDDETARLDCRKGGKVVAECDQVMRDDAVLVFIEDFVRQLPAFEFLAESQQVVGQLDFGWQELRVVNEGASLVAFAFGEPVFLGEFLADKVIDVRVASPLAERFIPKLAFEFRLVVQMGDRGAVGPSRGLVGIDLQDLVDGQLGIVVVFCIDQVVDVEEQARDMPRVDGQCRDVGRLRGFGVTFAKGHGQPVEGLRVFRIELRRLLEILDGERVIVFC